MQQAVSTTAIPKRERRYDLDWLKVITTLLVFLFHSAHVFDKDDWNVKYDPVLADGEHFTALVESGRNRFLPLMDQAHFERLSLSDGVAFPPIHRALQQIATSADQVIVLPFSALGTDFVYYNRFINALKTLKQWGIPLRVLTPNAFYAQTVRERTGLVAEPLAAYLAAPPSREKREWLLLDRSACIESKVCTEFLEYAAKSTNRVIIAGTNQQLAADLFTSFLNQWFMPLFFFISGAGTWFALQFRTAKVYLCERVNRLLVPFIFGCLVVVPLQVYCTLQRKPDFKEGPIEFYLHFLNLGPGGYFSWEHLWFVLYLFVFSVVALPLFIFLRGHIEKIASFFTLPITLFLFALPIAVGEALLREHWPNGNQNLYDDWANIAYYLQYFIYGYLLTSVPAFVKAIDRIWKFALGLAIVLTLLTFFWQFSNQYPFEDYSWSTGFYFAVGGLCSWAWVIGLVGAARLYLNFSNPQLKYSSEAAYPFYILHQTFVVVVAFFVVRTSLPAIAQFLLLIGCAFIAIATTYELIVRRVSLLRQLFGSKV